MNFVAVRSDKEDDAIFRRTICSLSVNKNDKLLTW